MMKCHKHFFLQMFGILESHFAFIMLKIYRSKFNVFVLSSQWRGPLYLINFSV